MLGEAAPASASAEDGSPTARLSHDLTAGAHGRSFQTERVPGTEDGGCADEDDFISKSPFFLFLFLFLVQFGSSQRCCHAEVRGDMLEVNGRQFESLSLLIELSERGRFTAGFCCGL